MKKMIAAVAAVVVVAAAAGAVGFRYYMDHKEYEMVKAEKWEEISRDGQNGETELTALADSQEEADEIAELYGIELKSYSYGVAVFTTEEDPQKLMQLGEEEGYPELQYNYTFHLDEKIIQQD